MNEDDDAFDIWYLYSMILVKNTDYIVKFPELATETLCFWRVKEEEYKWSLQRAESNSQKSGS